MLKPLAPSPEAVDLQGQGAAVFLRAAHLLAGTAHSSSPAPMTLPFLMVATLSKRTNDMKLCNFTHGGGVISFNKRHITRCHGYTRLLRYKVIRSGQPGVCGASCGIAHRDHARGTRTTQCPQETANQRGNVNARSMARRGICGSLDAAQSLISVVVDPAFDLTAARAASRRKCISSAARAGVCAGLVPEAPSPASICTAATLSSPARV